MSANIRPPDEPAHETPADPIRHELRFQLTDSMRDEFAERTRTGFASEPRRVYSIYYDTPSGALWRQGIALRVRAVDGGYLQTVKVRDRADGTVPGPRWGRIPADPFDGLQWERVTLTPLPEAAALPPENSPVGAVVRDCLPLLRPAFETDIQRQARIIVPEEGVRFELACDVGAIRATGGLVEAISEVQLSQQAGPDSIFHRYALQWARLHRATLLTDTRHARGMTLAGFPPSDVFPAPRRRVLPDRAGDAHTAARQVVGARLEQFIDHLPAALESTLPRGPQQLRIALRRLRAAIRFFDLREDRFLAHDQPWRAIDRTAVGLLGAGGPLWRCDRVLLGLLPVLDEAFPRDPALARLGSALEDFREICRLQWQRHLQEPGITEFVLLTAAALGTLTEPAEDRAPQGTRLGTVEAPHQPSPQPSPQSPRPLVDAAGKPGSTAGDDAAAAGQHGVTSMFDSSPGGITVWADQTPTDRLDVPRLDVPRFDVWATNRLNQLATRLHEQAGDAGISDDWDAVHASLRQLRLALKVAGPASPGQSGSRRLLRRLRQWEWRLAGDLEIEATRETIAEAMRRVKAPDALLARVLGLIDGHWAVTRQRRTGSESADSRRRKALKWRNLKALDSTLNGVRHADDADDLLQALHNDALGPVSQSRKLRRLLRRYFDIDLGPGQEAERARVRPQARGHLAPQIPAHQPAVVPGLANAFSPVAAPASGRAGGDRRDDRVIDLSGRAWPGRPAGPILSAPDRGMAKRPADASENRPDDSLRAAFGAVLGAELGARLGTGRDTKPGANAEAARDGDPDADFEAGFDDALDDDLDDEADSDLGDAPSHGPGFELPPSRRPSASSPGPSKPDLH